MRLIIRPLPHAEARDIERLPDVLVGHDRLTCAVERDADGAVDQRRSPARSKTSSRRPTQRIEAALADLAAAVTLKSDAGYRLASPFPAE